MTSPDLHSLLDRVRKATGPDAVLDAEIAATIGPVVMRQTSDGSYAFFDRRRDNMCFLCNVRSAPFDELSTCLSVPSYSLSLDATVALIEEKLPGWQRASGTCGEQDMPWPASPNLTSRIATSPPMRRTKFSPFSTPSSKPLSRCTMTKPDDIPQDVLDVAHGIAMDLPARIQAVNRAFAASVIARAILAERERCALVAEAQGRRYSEPAVGHSIATTIRNGSHS